MSLTIIICIITAIVSVAANPRIFQGMPHVPGLQDKLSFIPYVIKREGEWYRFLSHGFVHASMGHLFINLFVLFQFGLHTTSIFTRYFGQEKAGTLFILFYFTAIIVASIYSYFKHQDNPNYTAVGASGGTSAIITSYVIDGPWEWFVFPPVPAIVMLVGYLWYSNDMAKKGRDNIGHDAHFYGMVYGVAFIAIVSLNLNPQLLFDFWGQFILGPSMPNF